MSYSATLRGTVLLLLASTSTLGCFAHSRGEQDWDDKPVFTTGTGATILYPGQTAPTYYSTGQPAATQPPTPGSAASTSPQAPQTSSYGSAPTTQVGPNGERSSSGPQPGGMPITMIGGAEQDSTGHLSWKQDPAWMKYLTLPFAIIAAPFKAMAGGEPEPGPEIPPTPPVTLGTSQSQAAAPYAAPAPPLDYESEMVDQLERELDQRSDSQSPSGAKLAAGPNANVSPSSPLPGSTSIADELAALKREPAGTHTGASSSARPSEMGTANVSNPAPSAATPADGVVDRDQDGRIDQWIFRNGGEIERIELDENGDGMADRSIHYDLATNQIRLVEEDADGDGQSDSWTEYENGKVSRRRSDANFDGNIDTWGYYRDGVITRHERDTNNDGFRDRVGIYREGKLVREDQDRDGDGSADAKIHYDASEHVTRREEDNDSDGRTDVVSYYESGRLARRELLRHDDEPETGTH